MIITERRALVNGRIKEMVIGEVNKNVTKFFPQRYTTRGNIIDICPMLTVCNLKPRSEHTFVTQLVHNKLYKFIKNTKQKKFIKNYYNCIIVYNNNNKDFYHFFEKFQFHFKLCNTRGQ